MEFIEADGEGILEGKKVPYNARIELYYEVLREKHKNVYTVK
jgi:hypothetical protein